MKWKTLCFASMLILKCTTANSQYQLLDLEMLIEQANYEKAYQVAEAQLLAREGDPKFDYLYAVAALKSGHTGPALFAFERVLAEEPENHEAHYYYAYAYYQSKVYSRAYIEARKLKLKAISPELDEKLNILILKITREEKADPQKWFFISLTGGYDSNVNGGVNESNIQLAGLGFVPLDVDAKRFTSDFMTVRVGAGAVWPWHGKMTTQVLGSWRRNERAHLFDKDDYVFYARYEFPFRVYHLAFPFSIEQERLNNHDYRSGGSAGVELSYAVSEKTTLRPFFNLIAYDYPKDATQTSKIYWGGFTVENKYKKIFLKFLPYWGSQVINDGQYHYNNRTFAGGDIMLRVNHWYRVKPFTRLVYQYSTYHYPHPLIETGIKKRGDNYYHGELGLDWRLAKHFYVTMAGIREINESNFNVFEYHRSVIKASVTYSSL